MPLLGVSIEEVFNVGGLGSPITGYLGHDTSTMLGAVVGNCTAVGVGVGGVTMVGTGCSLTNIWNHDRYQNEDITNVTNYNYNYIPYSCHLSCSFALLHQLAHCAVTRLENVATLAALVPFS